MAATLGFSLLYGTLHLSLTKYAQWDTDGNLIAETYDSVDEIAAACRMTRFIASMPMGRTTIWGCGSIGVVCNFSTPPSRPAS